MNSPDPNFVYGYAQLAKLLGINAGTLNVRKHRGKFNLEPVYFIGRTAVFDKQAALTYAGIFSEDTSS